MKLTPLLPLLTLCVAINGCSDSGDEAPVNKPKTPEPTTFSNVSVNPRASWTTTDQRESVVIAPTTLTFPASGNDALLKKVAGDILVSDRSTKGNNPHGFLRKVVSVSKQGTSIVVTTEQAFLNEVIVGQFDVVAQPDDLRAMTAEELGPSAANYDVVSGQGGPGLSPLGEVSAGFDLGGDVKDRKLFAFSTPALTVPVKGHNFEIKGTAEATLKEGSFHFKPSIRVGGEIDTPDGLWDKFNPVNYVDEFHVITKGEVTTKLELAGSGKITTESPDTLPKAVQEGMKDLSSKINSKIQGTKAAEELALTLVKLPFVGPPLPTPVGPIPMTYEFEIKLECKASLTGGLEASIGFSGQSTAEFGTRYERDKGWSPIKSFDMGITKIGPNYTANGAVGIECALKPKLSTKVAGVAGPFLEIAGKIGAEGSYKESCDGVNDAKPKGEVQASVKGGFEVAIGAEAKISVLSYEVNLGEASFPLYNKEWPIWESGKLGMPEGWALGYCTGEDPIVGTGGSGGAGGGAGGSAGASGGSAGASAGGASAGGAGGASGGSSGGTGGGSSTGSCGDGKLNNGEQCDGAELAGMTCKKLLFGSSKATGNPTCTADCKYDVSSCDVGAVCGDVCTFSENPQKIDCGDCQKTVCQTPGHEYCCTEAWDIVCVEDAKTLCGQCGGLGPGAMLGW